MSEHHNCSQSLPSSSLENIKAICIKEQDSFELSTSTNTGQSSVQLASSDVDKQKSPNSSPLKMDPFFGSPDVKCSSPVSSNSLIVSPCYSVYALSSSVQSNEFPTSSGYLQFSSPSCSVSSSSNSTPTMEQSASLANVATFNNTTYYSQNHQTPLPQVKIVPISTPSQKLMVQQPRQSQPHLQPLQMGFDCKSGERIIIFNQQVKPINSTTTIRPLGQNENQLLNHINGLESDNARLVNIARLALEIVGKMSGLQDKQFVQDAAKLETLVEGFNQNTKNPQNMLPLLKLPNSQTPNLSQVLVTIVKNPIGTSDGSVVASSPSNQNLVQFSQDSSLFIPQQNHHDDKKNSKRIKIDTLHPQPIQQPSLLFKKLTSTNNHSNQLHVVEIKNEIGQLVNFIPSPTAATKNYQELIGSLNSSLDGNKKVKANSKRKLNTISSSMPFGDSQLLNAIPSKATANKAFKCMVCDKMFATMFNLNRHFKMHTNMQTFVCTYRDCRKTFSYNYHLKRHMETHSGLRPFACTFPDCDQRFNRKYNLNRHLWVHSEKVKKGQHETLINDQHGSMFVPQLQQTSSLQDDHGQLPVKLDDQHADDGGVNGEADSLDQQELQHEEISCFQD